MKKTKLTASIAIVILTISAFMLLINAPVQAQSADEQFAGELPSGITPNATISTEAYLSVSPKLIGENQILLVNMWMHPPIHVQRQFIGAFKVTFTKPDGTKDIIDGIDSYAGDASSWFPYQVDKVGLWTAKFDFIGTYFPTKTVPGSIFAPATTLESVYYEPSSTPEVEFVVQEEQVLSWPPSPLPTDYWERPVSPENREWWPILGFYPETGVVGGGTMWDQLYPDTNIYMSNYEFVPWVQAPNSAHVMWKRDFMIGGLVGGPAGQITLTAAGLSGGGFPSIIYAGRAYDTYTDPETEKTLWRCYDIRTGEVYWEKEPATTTMSFFGMTFTSALVPTFVEYAAQGAEVPGATAREGVTPYLVAISGGRLLKWDPYTGALSINVTGPPSGVSDGTLYGYPYVLSVQNLGGGNYRLINWTIENNAGNWVTAGGGMQPLVDNFTERVKGNITWPWSNLGTVQDFESMIAVSASGITSSATGVTTGQLLRAADMNTGEEIWNLTTDLNNGSEFFFSTSNAAADHGKFACRMLNGEIWAWNLDDGSIAWKNPISDWPWGVFGPYDVESAYGLYFTMDYAGVRAINWTTGKTEWTYKAQATPFETPYSWGNTPTYSWHSGGLVADGKLFTFTTEHTPTQPITRGWKLHAIDVFTGEGVWNITLGQGVPGSRSFQGAIADGYLIHTNEYDGYVYCFGKGESETTVTASPKTIAKGAPVLIEGTVLDHSPAQLGTPCVSKESMATQMECLHMQLPIDGIWHNVTVSGVPVVLTAKGENGESYYLGTATTEGYHGTFGLKWTPQSEGLYEIIASFEGDDSYGSSSATTWITVGPAPSPAQPQTEEPTTEAPTTEAPTTEAPTTEAPTTEAPTSEVPTTEQPSGEASAFPTTEVIIVAAVAVAIGIGVGAYWALRRQK